MFVVGVVTPGRVATALAARFRLDCSLEVVEVLLLGATVGAGAVAVAWGALVAVGLARVTADAADVSCNRRRSDVGSVNLVALESRSM